MQFIKTRDVKSPERDVSENAGIDFYIPENTPEFRQAFIKKTVKLVDAEVSWPGFSKKEDTIERRLKWCVENNWSYLYDNKIYIQYVFTPTGPGELNEDNIGSISLDVDYVNDNES